MSKNSKPNILIIDDEMIFYEKFRWNLEIKFRIWPAPTIERAEKLLKDQSIDLILLDLALDGDGNIQTGLSLIQPLKTKWHIPVIVVTSDPKPSTVMEALQLGADYYLQKAEYEPDHWITVIEKQLASTKAPPLTKVKNKANKTPSITDSFITENAKLIAIKERLKNIADNFPQASVLLLGETGVGKEVAARYFHSVGKRAEQPFLAINMTSLNESTLERELFGHEKGAFTGAIESLPGYFENANGGVLFLDEIGEIDIDLQKKLLRVLQDHTIRRIGGKVDKKLDLQIIFATNKDLRAAVQAGQMRSDFYFRISKNPIALPPLRERPEDIPPLITHFLAISDICPVADPFHGKTAEKALEADCLSYLQSLPWAGNVRELQNCCQQMLINASFNGEKLISIHSIPADIRLSFVSNTSTVEQKNSTPYQAPISIEGATDDLELQEALVKLKAFEKALIECAGRKKDAAQKLGLKNDQNLRYRIKKKWFVKFPKLFDQFPTIKKAYKL